MTRIEIGITHEIVINGDKSWVRLAIADDYDIKPDPLVDGEGITLDDAVDTLAAEVNLKLIEVIEKTVETVNNYGKA